MGILPIKVMNLLLNITPKCGNERVAEKFSANQGWPAAGDGIFFAAGDLTAGFAAAGCYVQ
jgi:hypothetical protein